MSVKRGLRDDLESYLKALEEKQEANLAAYLFLQLLETKARMTRLGMRYNTRRYRRVIQVTFLGYRKAILEAYKGGFGPHLPKKVRDLAKQVEANLELLARGARLPKEKRELVTDLTGEVFFLLVHRDQLELVRDELHQLIPCHSFRWQNYWLNKMDYEMGDLYFPHRVESLVKTYVRENNVSYLDSPWFAHESIDYIPLYLGFEIEEMMKE
jgi:hypothetical protein